MRLRAGALGLLPALAALLLAACGSGSGPGDDDAAATAADAVAEAPDDASVPAVPAVAAAADAAQVPTSERFELGKNYIRLSPTQPTSSSPTLVEVAEVFWYGCPHCYAFETYLKKWNASKAGYINFVRIPAVWNPLLRLHARAFYTAEALGKGEEMHDAFFNAIHVEHNPLDSEDKLTEFFGRFGVDADTFKRTFDSYAVEQKVQHADELNRRYRIESVPSLVVNGKYVTSGSMVGSYDDLLSLVDELAAAENSRGG
ncbi:MAG TPA: thiol:disulfide interchange protein DsbA/DsbL [Gammaproteobacteria bacterium]|nr:thiol:disulfide interchange protein DsbA/DsbL [Gammaproteobacteria bacterium]